MINLIQLRELRRYLGGIGMKKRKDRLSRISIRPKGNFRERNNSSSKNISRVF
jgi:hypothetical protein